MKVYIVGFTCGDFYCGCLGDGDVGIAAHIEGVYATREKAEEVAAEVDKRPSVDAWVAEADVE